MLPVESKPPRERKLLSLIHLLRMLQFTNHNPFSCFMNGIVGNVKICVSAIATATPINPPIDLSRPSYPRTQYTMSRAHVTLDQNESPYAPSGLTPQYDPPTGGYGQTGSYAPGMNIAPPPQVQVPPQINPNLQNSIDKRPGHPLKSFSVPAPPPTSAPGTPHSRSPAHVVRPGGSPYKKLATINPGSPSNTSRISASNPPPHTVEEIQRLAPSQSTEELNQEMANLEGLMKDLSAITANQFEC